MAKEKLIQKESLIAKIAKVAGISKAKATKAYECVLKEAPAFRKQSIKTVTAKDQVAVAVSAKPKIKVVKLKKGVPTIKKATTIKKVNVVKEKIVEKVVEKIVQVEVIVEKIIEKPIEIIKEVEVIKEVKVEVIKEVIKEVKVVKEVPVEVIKEITLIREVEVPVEVIKEVPVEVIREIEVIKEVEVVKSFDMAMLQKMMTKVGTVEVSRKVSGETRNEKEAVIVSRRELKGHEVSKGKVVKSKRAKPLKKTKSSTKTKTKSVKKDDLTKIEGIGPKISQLLQKAGIKTFKELSVAKQNTLKEILAAAGSRYQMHNPGSWPKQSKLAAANKWDQLKKLQDELDGGK